MRRFETKPGVDRCDGCVDLQNDLNELDKRLSNVLGSDMNSGILWKTLNDHVGRYNERGARMGEIEKQLAALNVLKIRIQLLSMLGVMGLAAGLKALADWLF